MSTSLRGLFDSHIYDCYTQVAAVDSSHSVTEVCEVSYLLFRVAKGWWDYALDRASTKYTDDPSLTRIFIIS